MTTTSEATPNQQTELDAVGIGIGRIAGGVYILTTSKLEQDDKAGMLVSWVQQVGFEPPSITVAVKPDRESFKTLTHNGRFTLNVVAKGQNHLMKAFSHYQPDQFEQVKTAGSDYGIHLTEAVCALDCEIQSVVGTETTQCDHALVVAKVCAAKLYAADAEPFVHLRKTGMSY